MSYQAPAKHGPLAQPFHLRTFCENKVIMKYVGFCQMLLKKPHKIIYEIISDSYIKKIPPPFPNSFYSIPCPAPCLCFNTANRSKLSVFLSISYVLDIPILSHVYFGSCFDFLFFLRFSVDTNMSVKDFCLLLLGEKTILEND